MPERHDKRRSPRIPLEQLRTEMEIGGVTYPVRVSDLSQEGVRIELESPADISLEQEVRIAVGKISPNVRGRVRWIAPHTPGEPARIGIEFESFVLEPAAHDSGTQDLLNAWREISQSYTIIESFLQILISLDGEIVNGKLDDLSEAVHNVTVWLDGQVGPLNLWAVVCEPDGSYSAELLVNRHARTDVTDAQRHTHVVKVATDALTAWLKGKPYIYGGEVVIEYLGASEGQVDLLQRLAVLLSKRTQFWSKLLMKNIALTLFGEEVERLQSQVLHHSPA